MRLIDWKTARWEDRPHFFGVSTVLMRRIPVDFARIRPKLEDQVGELLELKRSFGKDRTYTWKELTDSQKTKEFLKQFSDAEQLEIGFGIFRDFL